MPTATAKENRTASMSGRPSATLTRKIETLSTTPTFCQQPGEPGQPELELGLWVALAQADGDPPELRRPPGRDDDGISRPFVHDGAHEQARRLLRKS